MHEVQQVVAVIAGRLSLSWLRDARDLMTLNGTPVLLGRW